MQHVTTGWQSLSDDPLRHILTYVPVHECRRGPGVVSRALRATATSPALARARFCEPYTLRGDGGTGALKRHGVVHAMATACGTRRWPMNAVSCSAQSYNARAPPPALSIAIDRGLVDHRSKNDDECFAHGIVDPVLDDEREETLAKGTECGLASGALVAYTLPFKLALSQFRFAFGCCRANYFDSWVFEAFDSEQDGWRVLYDSEGVSPWADESGGAEFGQHKLFQVHSPFASSRFRIRLAHDSDDYQCMHIRGLELFGTILPPWRID